MEVVLDAQGRPTPSGMTDVGGEAEYESLTTRRDSYRHECEGRATMGMRCTHEEKRTVCAVAVDCTCGA